MKALPKNRSRPNGPRIPNGRPRPGGRLANFIAKQDSSNHPVYGDEMVYVSVEGQHPRKATIGRNDFLRITRDPDGPRLTGSRWWLDEDNMLRAFSLNERPFEHGILVAAALLNAKEGDTLALPADPFDLRLSQIKRV
jgi:hypothetical protein